MKFKRIFRMFIEVDNGETIEVDYPMTLVFSIKRSVLSSSNTGNFQLYNLKADNRQRIHKDAWDTLTYRRVMLMAGYVDQNPLPTIFRGNINSASSYRVGSNFITEIAAFDGLYGTANGQVSRTVPAGYFLPETLNGVLGTMPKVTRGAIGAFSQQSGRGLSLIGNSWDVAFRIVSGQNGLLFIDNEQYNAIRANEYIEGVQGITLITADTGLLNTPRRYENALKAEVIFEPRIQVGQNITLESLERTYNGQYQVNGIEHSGTISGAVCDTVKTVVSMWRYDERKVAVRRAA